MSVEGISLEVVNLSATCGATDNFHVFSSYKSTAPSLATAWLELLDCPPTNLYLNPSHPPGKMSRSENTG